MDSLHDFRNFSTSAPALSGHFIHRRGTGHVGAGQGYFSNPGNHSENAGTYVTSISATISAP